MSFEKFIELISEAIILPVDNIDTDQIIPARFLKTTTRENFGKNLFYDWRYDKDGEPIESFILNNSDNKGRILVAGNNFGCGSSREHAAWALYDYGFRAVISTFFADIFKNNALNNGLLPIQVSRAFFQKIVDNSHSLLDINLPMQSVTIISTGDSELFDINTYKKDCLINGFDDIDFLLSNIGEIEKFEQIKSTSRL
ncbi:MAG TPA: 3-isopropylmalate dehydratase small subunit [Bacteroidales bacterium]|nr:3-isopropylmalate dehydratase small subunit [Bacteroidales bacterium]